MTGNEPTETAQTAEIAVEKPAKKTKDRKRDKAKVKSPRVKAAKVANPENDFDFIGKVESLKVKTGAGPAGFEFGLRGRNGKRRNCRFVAGDDFAMNAMAHLVLSAHAGEIRIGVRGASEVDGVLIVRELESRPKLRKAG